MKVSKSSDIDREGIAFAQLKFSKLGYIFREQPIMDIGVDAHIEVKHDTKSTGKMVGLQIKSGESYFKEENETYYIYRGDIEHLDYWLNHTLPILVVLYHPNLEELFWEVINKDNAINTGKGWKVEIPKHQKVNIGMVENINKLTSKLLAFNDYTIASIKDLSHCSAKRYDVRIVLNKVYSQLDLIQLSKNLVIEIKHEVYYRSILTQKRWSDKKAHVVWLLIYTSAEDEKNDNHIAHIEWIDESLTSESSPKKMNGEKIGDGIILQWNDSYKSMAQLYESNSINKTEFISITDKLTKIIVSSVNEIDEFVSKLNNKTISEQEYLKRMQKLQKIINFQYTDGISIGVAPFECKDLGQQFQTVIALADNILIPFSGIGNSSERQLDFNFLNMCLRQYRKGIEGYNFERRKM